MSSFYFANGEYLWILAVILPLIFLLNYLSYRRKKFVVSSLLLWKRLVERIQTRRSSSRRFFSLPLLLLLLACTFFTFSLSEPFVRKISRGKLRLLIIRSAATAALTPEGSSVLKNILEQAESLIGDSDATIHTIPPSEGEGHFLNADAKRFLKSLAPSHIPRPSVLPSSGYDILFSDRPEKTRIACAILPAGSIENCAITSVGTKIRNNSLEAVIHILWTGSKETYAELKIEANDKTVFSKKLLLKKDVNIEKIRVEANSSLYKVTVDCDKDGFQLDNVAYITRIPKAQRKIVYLGEEEEAVLRALEAAETDVLRYKEEPKETPIFALYNGIVPKKIEGNGTVLLLSPKEGISGWFSLRPLGRKSLQAFVSDFFVDANGLSGTVAERVYEIIPDESVERTVYATDDSGAPVICSLRKGTARMVVIGFDVAKSNWKERASFPVFFALILRSMFGEEEFLVLRVGETITLPCKKSEPFAQSPSGKKIFLKPYGGAVSFVPDEVGIWRLTTGEKSEDVLIGVGLLSESESRIDPSWQRSIPKILPKQEEIPTPLWEIFLLLGLFLMVIFFLSTSASHKPTP